MKQVYLDNAATTALDKEVLQAMLPYMEMHYGNPSSIHAYGREVKTAIENARKQIAGYLHVSPSEIFFTSGGTEANNMALQGCVRDLGITRVISSQIEHHAVLHTLENLQKRGLIRLHFVNLLEDGHVDMEHLEQLLADKEPEPLAQPANGVAQSANRVAEPVEAARTLVSLMHANNEIGNLLSIKKTGELCEKYQAIFHSDMVQTMGHYAIDLQQLKVHIATCAAHKFYGPKGVGFIYLHNGIKIKPFIAGGAQERNMRAGTENVYGIIGLAKAFEMAQEKREENQHHLTELKKYMIQQLLAHIPGVTFNGDYKNGVPKVLNVSFPPSPISEMLLFRLDIDGIACSGGSACSSGSEIGSHVLSALKVNPERPSVRFSFGKFNTKEDIDFCIEKLKELFPVKHSAAVPK